MDLSPVLRDPWSFLKIMKSVQVSFIIHYGRAGRKLRSHLNSNEYLNKFRINLPLKLSSSFGRLLASQAGVSRTGFAKNGAFSTSLPPSVGDEQRMDYGIWRKRMGKSRNKFYCCSRWGTHQPKCRQDYWNAIHQFFNSSDKFMSLKV